MFKLRCRNKLQGFIHVALLAASPALHAAAFPVEAMFEAEAAAPGGPWTQEYLGSNVISGGSYLSTPSDLARADTPGAAAELSYTVAVPRDGNYTVWLRVLAPAADAASLYLALDNGAYASVSVPFISSQAVQWTWVPVTRWLAAGAREIKLKYRDGGVGIDCLLVTALADFVPQGYGAYPLPTVLPPPGEHPRLFARVGDLPAIRSRFESNAAEMVPHRAVLNAFIQAPAVVALQALPPFVPGGPAMTNHQTDVVSSIKAKALSFLLYERNGAPASAQRGREAVQMLLDYLAAVRFSPGYHYPNEKGDIILASAMVYDWCFNLMNVQQRAYVVTRFTQIAATMEIGFPPSRQGAVVGHGSDNQLLRDQLSAAIAFYDEAPLVYNIVAGRFFADYIAPRNYAYAAQAYQQGASYGTVRFLSDMYAAWLFRRMGAAPVFDPVQQMTPYHWLYARRPDGQWMRDGDVYHSAYTNSTQYWSEPLAVMLPATYYNNPTLKHEYLKQSSQQSASFIHPKDSLWPVLLGNTAMSSTPSPATLPLTKYFPDPAGLMIARTGWTDGMQVESGNVIATLKLGGDWFGNHEHYDAGHFQLYYKGGLAIDSGIYSGRDVADPAIPLEYGSAHDMNYHKRTIAHNTMLVYDPNENFDGYANDGGQRFPGEEPGTLAELANGYKVASVLRHQSGPQAQAPDFSYIKGDLTAAYSSKVRQFQRSFVFLNLKNTDHPAALVVFDRVSASDAGFRKTWLLHSQSEPEIAGDTVVVRRTEWDYNHTYQYNGKLINRTLLPANAVLAKVGGSGNEFSVSGINYPIQPEADYSTEEAGAWRLEVSPPTGNETDLFLNIMQVMDAGSSLPALPTTAIASPLLAGVQIKDRVVLFSRSGMPLGGTITVELPAQSASMQVLVTDLQAGSWTVRKRGTGGPIEDEVNAEAGTLYFVASGGGLYDLQRNETGTARAGELPGSPAVP
jgi:hypothetical protein